jgi:hypothetical protein
VTVAEPEAYPLVDDSLAQTVGGTADFVVPAFAPPR